MDPKTRASQVTRIEAGEIAVPNSTGMCIIKSLGVGQSSAKRIFLREENVAEQSISKAGKIADEYDTVAHSIKSCICYLLSS